MLSLQQAKINFWNAGIGLLNFLIEFSFGCACVRKIAGFPTISDYQIRRHFKFETIIT